jgi:hypothetical protein
MTPGHNANNAEAAFEATSKEMTNKTENSMFLTATEVRELTARIHSSSQLKVLRSMGIEHRSRPDASIAVLRKHVEEVLGGSLGTKARKPKEPNWGAIHVTRT